MNGWAINLAPRPEPRVFSNGQAIALMAIGLLATAGLALPFFAGWH